MTRAASLLRPAGALVASVPVVCGGVGWLYLLRASRAFAAGPSVQGALPLQRLAGGEAQPLARVLAAWLGAAAVEAVLLAVVLRGGRVVRAAVAAAAAALTLTAAGAVSDAVTASNGVAGHLAPQLSRGGLWIAVATMAAVALIPGPSEAGGGARHQDGGAGAAAAGTPRPA